jgi:hypothetical protein
VGTFSWAPIREGGSAMRWTMVILLAAAFVAAGCERESPSEPILEDPVTSMSLAVDMCRDVPGWQALGYKNLGHVTDMDRIFENPAPLFANTVREGG